MCPDWCAKDRAYWAAIVDRWCSNEWMEKHNIRRDCRLQMGGVPHHQGNRHLGAYAQTWVTLFIFISLFIRTLNSHYL